MCTQKIYLKSPDWIPPFTSCEIEEDIDNMEKALEKSIKSNKYRYTTNMTREDHILLKEWQDNDDFIIVPADKNLEPCIVEREEYIKRYVKEHLSNSKTYRRM